MTAPRLDITGDVCPMTFVKVKMGLAGIASGGTLCVRLREGALKDVVSSLKSGGYRVAGVSREGSIFILNIERGEDGK